MQVHPPSLIRAPLGARTIELRAPSPRDAAALVEAIDASVPALRRFMPWAHLEQTVERQYARLVEVQREFWGDGFKIYHLWEGARMLGCAGLHDRTLNSRGAELGYWTRSDVAGQGVGTLAARVLVVVAVEHLELERLQLLYLASNHGSRRIAEKCGFQIEGRMRCFQTAPTSEQRADGMSDERVTVITALLRDEARALPWYAPLRAALELYDWDGAPLELARAGD